MTKIHELEKEIVLLEEPNFWASLEQRETIRDARIEKLEELSKLMKINENTFSH